MKPNMTTGRAAFLQLLVDEGVTHLFGNPGTTELAIMEVVPDFPQLKFILGLQESVVMAMADGYCRASGRLAAANVHVMPGLGNAMGALYNAKFSGSPAILAGQELAMRDAFGEAVELAELLGAAVFASSIPYSSQFPSEHPAFMGTLTRQQKQVRETLAPYDLLLVLGADLLRMSVYSPV